MIATALTSTTGIVAIAAATVAVVALLAFGALALTMRRMQRRQRLLLGEHGTRDLITHAASLQQAFSALEDYMTEAAERLEGRLEGVEDALARTISRRSLVHYDAYNETSGRQSLSIALLDAEQTGLVITCIHHRDQARVYAKELRRGSADRALSPEEAEAVHLALSSRTSTDTERLEDAFQRSDGAERAGPRRSNIVAEPRNTAASRQVDTEPGNVEARDVEAQAHRADASRHVDAKPRHIEAQPRRTDDVPRRTDGGQQTR